MDGKTTSDEAVSVEHIRRGVISVKSTALQFYCQATSSRRKGLMLSKVSRQFYKMQTLLIKWTRTVHNKVLGGLHSQHLVNSLSFQQPNANLLDFEQQIVWHIEYLGLRQLFHWVLLFSAMILVWASLAPFSSYNWWKYYLSQLLEKPFWMVSIWSSRLTVPLVWKLFITDFTQFRW